MKVVAELNVWSDDWNSDAPPVKFEVQDEYVTMYLTDTEREITFKRSEFDAFVSLYNASK